MTSCTCTGELLVVNQGSSEASSLLQKRVRYEVHTLHALTRRFLLDCALGFFPCYFLFGCKGLTRRAQNRTLNENTMIRIRTFVLSNSRQLCSRQLCSRTPPKSLVLSNYSSHVGLLATDAHATTCYTEYPKHGVELPSWPWCN